MSDNLAVDAHGLSKRYSIGQLESGYGLARRLVSRKDRRSVLWAKAGTRTTRSALHRAVPTRRSMRVACY